MSILASAMTGIGGERVALCDVAVDAVLHDLLCEVTVGQTYRNDEQVNIEALYTFPLPLDAVLLDLAVEIGGKVLQGVVVGKKEAEEKYEDAVSDGDAAVMLEALEPGLYTMNVGNLLPGEQAKVTFRYALLYRWSGDRSASSCLRPSLPDTVSPPPAAPGARGLPDRREPIHAEGRDLRQPARRAVCLPVAFGHGSQVGR